MPAARSLRRKFTLAATHCSTMWSVVVGVSSEQAWAVTTRKRAVGIWELLPGSVPKQPKAPVMRQRKETGRVRKHAPEWVQAPQSAHVDFTWNSFIKFVNILIYSWGEIKENTALNTCDFKLALVVVLIPLAREITWSSNDNRSDFLCNNSVIGPQAWHARLWWVCTVCKLATELRLEMVKRNTSKESAIPTLCPVSGEEAASIRSAPELHQKPGHGNSWNPAPLALREAELPGSCATLPAVMNGTSLYSSTPFQ